GQGGKLGQLKDVANVELGPEDNRSIFRYNGNPAVAIGVVRQSKANLIDVAGRIRAAIPGIQQTLPPGVKLETAWDGSVFVTHSINDARVTLLIAAILVVLIIFVFLRNLRATVIPGLAVAGAVVISGFVALTLTPMLCAKVLRVPHEHGAIFKVLERGFTAVAERYAELLQTALRHRGIVVAGTVVTVALAFVIYRNL